MIRLGDEHGLEPARPVAVGAEDLQLVQPLHVEGERGLLAVDLPLERVPPAERKPGRLDRPDRRVLELDCRLDRVVDLATRQKRLHERRHRRDISDQVPREVDHVRAQIAERTGSRLAGMEAPGVQGRVVTPVLQVPPAEVADVAEITGVDDLAGEPHGRDEAVVERAQVSDTGRRDGPPDLVALGRVAAERLLADDVLPGLRGGDRRLRVDAVRPAVVEEPDRLVGDEVVPVRRPALVAVALRCVPHRLLVPAGNRDEPRAQRGWPGHVADLLVRVRVRLAHEGVPEHPDADLGDLAGCGLARRAGQARHVRCMAASKATSEGVKSVRRTNANASCAPHSRSIPESSHSIESGPV
jgi:hypothetical protein